MELTQQHGNDPRRSRPPQLAANEQRIAEAVATHVVSHIDKRFTDLENKMDKRLTDFENKMDKRFTGLENKMDKRLTDFENKMDKRFINFEVKMDKRFINFEVKMDKRFIDHMTEIEGYYTARDQKRDEDMAAIRDDYQTIISRLDEILRSSD